MSEKLYTDTMACFPKPDVLKCFWARRRQVNYLTWLRKKHK